MTVRSAVASLFAVVVLAQAAGGCARTVVDYRGRLEDGGKLDFPLKSGTYEVEMTATGDGAGVQWQGGECPGTGPVRRWKGRCRLTGPAKLVLRNPSMLHLGSASDVTLRVRRMPR